MQDTKDMMDVVMAEHRSIKSFLQDMDIEPVADCRNQHDQLVGVMDQYGQKAMGLLANFMVPNCTSVNELAHKTAERVFRDNRITISKQTLIGQELLRSKNALADVESDQKLYRQIIDSTVDSEVGMHLVKIVSEHIKRVELRELEALRFVRLLDMFRRKHNKTTETNFAAAAPPPNLIEPLHKLVAAARDEVNLLMVIDAMDNATKEQIIVDVFDTVVADNQSQLDLQVFSLVTEAVAAAASQSSPFSTIK